MALIIFLIVILIGTCFMVLSLLGTRKVLRMLKGTPLSQSWKGLYYGMFVFLIGYLSILTLLLMGFKTLLTLFIYFMFFFGVFVFFVVRAGYKTMQILLKTTEAAEEANKVKSDFLASMSHELRTPLNAIIGYSELLQEEAEELGQSSFVDDIKKINSSGKHLLTIINDILDLSKIEAGKMDLYVETFSIKNLIEDVMNTIQPLVNQNENKFIVNCEPAIDKMSADMQKVKQSLFNLLSNACKFTEQGMITLTVEPLFKDGSNYIAFHVEDTGIGMSQEQISQLFQSFTQGDSSTKRKYGGTGLGLTISQHYCQMMGGNISVSSTLTIGSKFTILLPAIVEEPQDNQNYKFQPALSSPADHKNTILIIEDDASVCDLISRFLEKDGYKVIQARNGIEGIEFAQKDKPHLVTLDLILPDIDGWQVLNTFKADPYLKDIPIIIITVTEDKERGFALGASEFITKPVDRGHLLNVVHKYSRIKIPRQALIIEDDLVTGELMQALLLREGWQTEIAINGFIALEKLTNYMPDIILLDLMMPEMNGFEFLMHLHTRAEWMNIPVIVVTAKELTKEDRLLLNGKVENVFQKGADRMETLLQQISEWVHKQI